MKRILIVEDSKALAMLAARKLKHSLECETLLAHSLDETQQLLENQPPDIFAAILDMTLPDAPQGEVVDYVVSKGIHSIVLTGTFGEEWRETLLAKNVVDYVLKRDAQDFDYIAELILRLQKNAEIKVLVVDDSISYRTYVKRLLQTQNLQVLDAVDGVEALEVLTAHPDIRLVITDYNMPRMDGVELVSRIRHSHTPDKLAVIGVSNEADATLSARFLKCGGSDFLSKPFSTEEFNCRVRLNIERIEQIEDLRQSLETKNRSLGIAAHDLRNPLGTIQGFSRILMQNTKLGTLSDAQTDILKTVINESKHMLELLNDLLDLSAIESGKLTLRLVPANLAGQIQERLQRSRFLADPKQITIEAEIQNVPDILVDLNRFAQIFDNLISNAIKYSHSQTVVTVRLYQEEARIRLDITDQGQGISPEDQARLFGDFQRLSSRPTAGERSTGLGLAIVKRMVEAHHWRIMVASTLGQGSTFSLLIPMPDSPQAS